VTRPGQAGIPGERRARKLKGQWVPRFVHMLESPAWRALSLSAHRALSRIEIEHMHHGGKENGQLPVTYDHFEEYGIHRHAIGPALRELEALGFIEITEHGVAGNADHATPNKFRLTHIHAGRASATQEWCRIKTIEEAEAIAKAARMPVKEPRKSRVQKQKPVPVFANSQCRIPPLKTTETWPARGNSPVSDSVTTSIFLGRTADVIPTAAAQPLSSLPSLVGSKSRKKSSRAKKSARAKKRPWSTPKLVEIYPSQKTIDQLKALYIRQAEQAGQPDDVWIPPRSPGQRILNETSHETLQQRSADAWQQCYELAWSNDGEAGVRLVDQARQNGGATIGDVLEAIEASRKTGKPLDYELASFLDCKALGAATGGLND
jgi:hypothetical protein